MKKIYLVAFLLLFPMIILAQVEDNKPIPEKTKDTVSTKSKEIKERIYPVKDSIPTAVEKGKVLTATKEKEDPSTIQVENEPSVETITESSTVTTPQCISGNCIGGIGTMKYQSGTYEGRWKNGLRHGIGTFTWSNGDTYHGSWIQDKRHGDGVYKWNDGSKYVGHYNTGIRSGYGVYYYTNGNIYEGTWQSNLKHGIANFYFKNSVNIGGKYVNNEYVKGTGINQENYIYKP